MKTTTSTSKAGNKSATPAAPKSGSSGSAKAASSNGKSTAQPKGANSDASKLHKLFEDELKDIYWAEKALTKALPKMAKNATSPELIKALQTHLTETEGQVSRIEQVFELIGTKAQAKKCEAMAGLIKEAEELMQDNDKGVMRDAAIISAGQKVEHYEIASYGTLRSFAQTLGLDEAAGLLEETLNEEKNADQTLTDVAESAINIQAASEDEEESEDDK
jgi:ferritin-like metal-binding protein YciE